MKFLKKLKRSLFFLFLSLIFFFILFFVNRFFLIKQIEIISDQKFLLTNKNELINKNLIFIDQNKTAKKILLENSQLRQVFVNKLWPSTLEVTVNFYDPIATLTVNNGFFYLSADGRILSKKNKDQSSLPVINYYQKLNSNFFRTGDWIDYRDIKQALFFIDILEQINLLPLTIDISGQDMLIFNLTNDKKVILSSKKEKELQKYQLESIIRQFKIEGREFMKIDLRFKKPVITF